MINSKKDDEWFLVTYIYNLFLFYFYFLFYHANYANVPTLTQIDFSSNVDYV